MLGFIMIKRGSLVRSVAAPAPSTRKRLIHCMVSIGCLRANCQPIWATPSAMPSTTAKVTLCVSR